MSLADDGSDDAPLGAASPMLAALVASGAGGQAAPQTGPSATDLLGVMQALQPQSGMPSGPVTVGHLIQLVQQLGGPRGAAGPATPPSGSITPDQLRALMPPFQPPPTRSASPAGGSASASATPLPHAMPRDLANLFGIPKDPLANLVDPVGSAGGAAGPPAASWWLDPTSKEAKFLDQNFPFAARYGAARGVDPALLLGVPAFESTWNTSNQARTRHNPFGYIPSTGPTTFQSLDQAWQQWDKTFGPRVQDVGSDAQRFLENLQLDNRNVFGPTIGGDYRGAYNSESEVDWPEWVGNTIQSIRNRLPHWLGNLDALP